MNTGTGNNKINPGSEMEEDENEVAQKRTPQDLKLEAMKQKDLISKKLERALVATKEQRVRACTAAVLHTTVLLENCPGTMLTCDSCYASRPHAHEVL